MLLPGTAREHGCPHWSAWHAWWRHAVHEGGSRVVVRRIRIGTSAVHPRRRLGRELHFERFISFRHALHLALQQSVMVVVMVLVVLMMTHPLLLLKIRQATIVIGIGGRDGHVRSVESHCHPIVGSETRRQSRRVHGRQRRGHRARSAGSYFGTGGRVVSPQTKVSR